MTIFTAKNILKAYKLARKSRKKKQEVFLFDLNFEANILKMISDLKNKNYRHSEYKKIILVDSKKRYIYSPGFKDHIIHHLVYSQIYDILDLKMTHTTFACRKGYGSHRAILYLNKLIKQQRKRNPFDRNFYLKIDFSKYFFSINHNILKKKLRKYIFNEEILYLLDLIIDSYKSPNTYDNLLKDNDFYINEPNKGLPIGGIISQILANFYLNDLDQYLKHKLKLKFVRYMDDILLLGKKEDLKMAKKLIINFVSNDKLILNPKKISFNLLDDGIKFVGYVFKNDKIFVGKKIKKGFLNFFDYLENNENFIKYFNGDDIKRINSMYFSRIGSFKISSHGMNFIKKRGNIDFLRGGNSNNAANTGLFMLNLNRSDTNQNRNVGFRCSQ